MHESPGELRKPFVVEAGVCRNDSGGEVQQRGADLSGKKDRQTLK
jgi:hypothetical protein